MPKLALSIALAAALAVVAVAVALAGPAGTVSTYRAALTTAGEVPKPKAPAGAKGMFTATLTKSGSTRTISWKLTFHGLSGKAVAAHIHRGKPGVAGAVLVPLCGPCTSGQTGKLKVSKTAADVLERDGAYVNVHTARNAAGEIRGQIRLLNHAATTTTPDPGTTTTGDPPYGGSPPPGY